MKIEYVTNYDDWFYLIIDGEIVDEGHNDSVSELVPQILKAINKKFENHPLMPIRFTQTGVEGDDEDGLRMEKTVEDIITKYKVDYQLGWMPHETRVHVCKLYNSIPSWLREPAIKSLQERGVLDASSQLTDLGKEIGKDLTKREEDRKKEVSK